MPYKCPNDRASYSTSCPRLSVLTFVGNHIQTGTWARSIVLEACKLRLRCEEWRSGAWAARQCLN